MRKQDGTGANLYIPSSRFPHPPVVLPVDCPLARRTDRQIFLNLNVPRPLPSDLFPSSSSFPSSTNNPASAISRSAQGMGFGGNGSAAAAAGGKDPVEAKLVLGLEKALVRVLQGDL